ncbi:MAG: AAA family ATPase [Nitrospinae bacterium]|nr:AAA family ATPase [Nitrospinota bacterium]
MREKTLAQTARSSQPTSVLRASRRDYLYRHLKKNGSVLLHTLYPTHATNIGWTRGEVNQAIEDLCAAGLAEIDSATLRVSLVQIEWVNDHSVESEVRWVEGLLIIPSRQLQTISALELSQTELPEQRWAIVGLLLEGVALLVAKPKVGKSWLALQLAIIVALGHREFLGEMAEEAGEVLYLALEDSQRRLKERLEMIMDIPPPDTLHLLTEFPRFDSGGHWYLDQWFSQHPHCRLVIIDTLARVRSARHKYADLYADDTALGAALQDLAKRYHVCILLVHHTNKQMKLEDPIDSVSGTQGLAGAVDTIWILRRRRTQLTGELIITGRDVEERQLSLNFTPPTGRWVLATPLHDDALTPERQAILECLTTAAHPMAPCEIAKVLNQPGVNVRRLLAKLYGDGLVQKNEHSQYSIPTTGNSSNSSNSNHSSNTGNSGNTGNGSP